MLRKYARFLVYDVKHAGRHLLLNRIAGSPLITRGLRIALYRVGGVRVGTANIYPGVRFLSNGLVTIGDGAMINIGTVIDNHASVCVGERVHIAPGVYIGTSTHELGDTHQRAGRITSASICIGAGAWIGARAVLLPGITIGPGAVIAAGAVVTKDCDAGVLYAGVPARAIKALDGTDQIDACNKSQS